MVSFLISSDPPANLADARRGRRQDDVTGATYGAFGGALPASCDYERFRRRTKPSAERPMPKSAKVEGSGTVAGVSENWFVK
jgi:hypothetical protein